jgi:hypothetical protein
VEEAIEDGVHKSGIADGPVPFFRGDLAYNEGGFSSVTVFDDFEEVTALLFGKRRDSPIVQDEEIEACEGVESLAERANRLRYFPTVVRPSPRLRPI